MVSDNIDWFVIRFAGPKVKKRTILYEYRVKTPSEMIGPNSTGCVAMNLRNLSGSIVFMPFREPFDPELAEALEAKRLTGHNVGGWHKSRFIPKNGND